MIMDYIPDGNLSQYLQNNRLSFKSKLSQLLTIAEGLKSIHEKELIHRDFHSGNILNRKIFSNILCYITDLGLCQPVNKTDDGVYGVLPYIAPEVLRNKGYAQASDIYSLGIMAYELFSGLPPYPNLAHDNFLGLKICQGLRPRFKIKIPYLLKNLIERC
jgi:serine/threonine protein kinase